MKIRLTAAASESLVNDANQLAAALGFSEADLQTYRDSVIRDSEGNLYSAASFTTTLAWVQGASVPPVRPPWDTEQVVDIDAATRAWAAMVVWLGEGEIPQASPDALTVLIGDDGPAALAMMGLAIEVGDDGVSA